MAKRPSKHLRAARPLSTSLAVTSSDGAWVVQRNNGTSATKTYLCPSCHRPIAPGTPHIVAWPRVPHLGSTSPMEERRHWHTPCWRREHP